jgi:hypothetical protein
VCCINPQDGHSLIGAALSLSESFFSFLVTTVRRNDKSIEALVVCFIFVKSIFPFLIHINN